MTKQRFDELAEGSYEDVFEHKDFNSTQHTTFASLVADNILTQEQADQLQNLGLTDADVAAVSKEIEGEGGDEGDDDGSGDLSTLDDENDPEDDANSELDDEDSDDAEDGLTEADLTV